MARPPGVVAARSAPADPATFVRVLGCLNATVSGLLGLFYGLHRAEPWLEHRMARHYLACSTAGVMFVTWMVLLVSFTVPETLTIFPTNFFAVVWSSS